MKWKKSLTMMLVFLMLVMVNADYAFAAPTEPYSQELPRSSDIEVLYEGNSQGSSNDFYRIIVKYPKASEATREIPQELVIYEKELPGGGKREVHRANFGADAGKPLSAATDKSFLDMYDSFYYRKFTVEKNKDQTDYEYSCEITFKEKTGRPAVTKLGTTPITVSIKNPIETEMLRVGTYNMFRGNAAIKLAYNKGHKSLPENHPIDTTGPADIWPMDTAFPGGEITINNTLGNNTFISNASLETHVMYTGPKLELTEKVKFILRSDYTFTNSKDIAVEVEVPAISDYLTKLAQKEKTTGFNNKDHFEVFMGKGSGAGGSIGDATDNLNAVAYLFAKDTGGVHTKFVIKIEVETIDPAKAGGVRSGFVFDYINIRYNPFILGSTEVGTTEGYVKPSGYMMLTDKFKVPGDTPKPEMTLNMDEVLKATGDLKQIIDFDETLNNPGKGIQLYLARDGGDWKNSTLAWKSGTTEKILKITIPGDYLIDIPDPEDLTAPDITHLKAGDYKIKMHIPTSMKPGYSTAAYKALMDANSVYPIQLKVIMDDPMFKDWPELQIRVDKTFKITPYKMPGIN